MSPEPRRVEIHLGTLCNNRCAFCMSSMNRDDHEPWAALERVKEELRHFRAEGCRSAGFLGGEPTVYPHIIESISYAKSLGYDRISLCTNGTRLSDRAFCGALIEAGLTRATLSVHSHRAEVEDGLITGVPGNFARKLAGIKNLLALRAEGRLPGNIALNPVLCRPNLGEMEEYLAFFGALGLDDVRFNYIWPQGEALGERRWIPSFKEAMPKILRVMLRGEKRPRGRLTFGGIPKCALLLAGVKGPLLEHLAAKYLDEAGFDPDNDVSMATRNGPMPDRFVWQEKKKDTLKAKGPACPRCAHHARCEGVWGSYAELYGFGELTPLAAAGPVLAESHEGLDGRDLLLRTTFACNQACAFCFVTMTGKGADFADIERGLDAQAARSGPRGELTLSGGEPASDPRLPAIIAAARARGFRRFVLQTNGVYLARPGLLDELIGLGVKTYLFSLHSHLPAVYDEITGSRGQQPRAVAGLVRLLRSRGCGVTVNVVVNARNYRDLPGLVDFVAALRDGRGRPGFYFSMINELGHLKVPDWTVALEDAAPYLRRAVARCRAAGLPVSRSGGESSFPPCLFERPARHASRRALPQERVRYTEEFSGDEGAVGRAKPPSCRKCAYDGRCVGVPAAYARLHGLAALRREGK
ncbi:MAG: radical SAM protein [Elusimicrobia bacterium]|nr:radical SAM protein [Elusimicrobiota bacterium]